MQIFIAMDYFVLMLQKYLHLKKKQKHVPREFLSPRRGNLIHYPRKCFLSYAHLKDLYKNLKETGISKLHKSLG